MARVLVIDPVERHAAALTLTLRQHHHAVTEMAFPELPADLERVVTCFDILIVNLTMNRVEDWDLLRRVCQCNLMNRSAPKVLAVSTTYRGPEPRLRAERLGSRWIYER